MRCFFDWLGRAQAALVGIVLFGATAAVPSAARADYFLTFHQSDGFYIVDHHDDDGTRISSSFYGPNDEYIGTFWFTEDGFDFTNPNPSDSDAGSSWSDDQLDLFMEDAKRYGAATWEQTDLWQELMIYGVLLNDLGPTVIDPWDYGSLVEEGGEWGDSGFGFDPNIPLDEQFFGSGTDDDEDDDDSSDRDDDPARTDPNSYGEYYGLDPEIVNPVPGYRTP